MCPFPGLLLLLMPLSPPTAFSYRAERAIQDGDCGHSHATAPALIKLNSANPKPFMSTELSLLGGDYDNADACVNSIVRIGLKDFGR